jgi:hypothetical protein
LCAVETSYAMLDPRFVVDGRRSTMDFNRGRFIVLRLY